MRHFSFLCLLAAVGLAYEHATAGPSPATATCDVTVPIWEQPPRDPGANPFGFGPWYINADRTIWAHWSVGWASGPRGNKVMWLRPRGTQLEVAGRRLDADAPPLGARIPCCYTKGFQVTRLTFPTSGCWEVTARAGRHALRFVTSIAR